MAKGEIVAGCLAPHPPHLVYAENPDQNEPVAEGGWEQLRWGYERLRESLQGVDYDSIVILSPHWQTYIGTHFLGLENFKSLSVLNLFRYHYDLNIDVDLSKQIHDKAEAAGLAVKMMTNPDFRVDYGTITTGHMFRPQWDKPLVVISSNRSKSYYSVEVMQEMMILARLPEAYLESGKKLLYWQATHFPTVILLLSLKFLKHEQRAYHQPCYAFVGHEDNRLHEDWAMSKNNR